MNEKYVEALEQYDMEVREKAAVPGSARQTRAAGF